MLKPLKKCFILNIFYMERNFNSYNSVFLEGTRGTVSNQLLVDIELYSHNKISNSV